MEDFDITKIAEQIENLSLEEKISFLQEECQRVQKLLKELLPDYDDDLDSLFENVRKEYIKTLRSNVLKKMQQKGLDVFEKNEALAFILGDLYLIIFPHFDSLNERILIIYESPDSLSKERRNAYDKLLNVLLADYGSWYWKKNLSYKDFEKEVVSVIERLMEAKDQFEEIKNTIK